MGVQITIRDVPEETRDELAVRAARNRQSMQAFLRQELERIVSSPTIDDWLKQVHRLRADSQSLVRAEDILSARHADLR